MDSIIGQIVSMGYDQEIAQKSFNATKSTDLNTNIEWIEKHLESEAIKASLEGTEGAQKMEEEKPKEETQEKPAETTEEKKWGPISHLVDPILVAQLQDMGFSKNVAEKAAFMTQDQKSLEAALAWTEQHQQDPDYEEQLLMQLGEEKPKLSEFELRQKARELQTKLREERQKREKQDEFEKEKKRILAGKSMGDAQREIQELKKRQDALQLKQQREQDAKDKQKILDQLQRDKEERFGKKFGASSKPGDQQQHKEPTQFEKFQVGVKQIKTAHPRNIFLDKAQVCLKTIQIYVQNMVNNPTEEKFRKINLENKAYQTRVGECFGAKESLEYLGFVEEGTFLVCHTPNFEMLKQALTFLEKEIQSS